MGVETKGMGKPIAPARKIIAEELAADLSEALMVGKGLSRTRVEGQVKRAWAEHERELDAAPPIIKRQKRKAWRRHQGEVMVDPAVEDFDPAADATLDPHAERALDSTSRFVQRRGKKGTVVVVFRTDHATIANDPDEHIDSRDSDHVESASLRKARASASIDDIDLAEAVFAGAETADSPEVLYDVPDLPLDPEIAARLEQDGSSKHSENRETIEAAMLAAIGDVPSNEEVESLLVNQPGMVSLDALATTEEVIEARRDGSRMSFSKYGLNATDLRE
ncbi:MAG: hypothetical protein ABSD69_00180 [Candidatus Levyibacteriota bacterium]|jgi:hypothetical protein